ncbi:MAG: YbaN family protein [Alphaproteobacteria bacterium]|nr:YbaN family protein [Alphaproteobacteria bacterium]
MKKLSHHTIRILFLCVGWIALILGIIGAFLPIMPTVPFLIVALWGFSKSSERFHNWLYTHKTYGPMLQAWDKYRAIPLIGKIWAILAMSGSLVIMIFIKVPTWAIMIAATIMISVGIYIITRPTLRPEHKTTSVNKPPASS